MEAFLERMRAMNPRTTGIDRYIAAVARVVAHHKTDRLAPGWFDGFKSIDAAQQSAWEALTNDEQARIRAVSEGV